MNNDKDFIISMKELLKSGQVDVLMKTSSGREKIAKSLTRPIAVELGKRLTGRQLSVVSKNIHYLNGNGNKNLGVKHMQDVKNSLVQMFKEESDRIF